MKPRTYTLLFSVILTLVFALIAISPWSHSLRAQEATETPIPNIIPRPAPTATVTESDITAELYFEDIKQGGMGLVHVTGENIAAVRARFFNHPLEFFPMADGWYGIISANMDLNPRKYDLDIVATYADNRAVTVSTQVEVVSGEFIRQDFAIPPERAYLIDPEIERAEFARLESVVTQFTPERLWTNAGFQLPISSELTSPFGAFRILNQTVQTRHTGWDLRATIGTPVITMGAGKVAFAGRMDIRGDYVLIDHGFGIYSGYAHLSQVHVTRGQTIADGQIIGVSGNSGRSSGPHLHWEMAINGEWIDSAAFMKMWLPLE